MPSMPNQNTTTSDEIERRQNVARVIRDHVAANGITVDELARQAGAANSALYNLVNLKRGMGRRLAEKLVNAGVNRNDLLRSAGFAMDSDKRDITVLLISKKIQRLPRDKREFIDTIVDGLLEAANKKKRTVARPGGSHVRSPSPSGECR